MQYSPIVKYKDQGPVKKIKRWTASTSALTKGYAMCYNTDYGTATTAETERLAYVEEPTQDNNTAFAGVLTQDYAASSSGQEVELAIPGGLAYCYVADASVTIGDYLTFYVGNGASVGAGHGTNAIAGQLSEAGYIGRGTVKVLQTLSSAGLALCELLDGPESGMCERIVPASTGGAITIMVGGKSYISGASVNDDDCTFTMAGSKYDGQVKGVEVTATLGNSKDLIITHNPTGLQSDKSTTLNTAKLDNDGDQYSLIGYEGIWQVDYTSGVAYT